MLVVQFDETWSCDGKRHLEEITRQLGAGLDSTHVVWRFGIDAGGRVLVRLTADGRNTTRDFSWGEALVLTRDDLLKEVFRESNAV